MGALLGECPQRVDLARETPGEKECQFDKLDYSRSPEWMIPLAQVQQWWLGNFCPVKWWSPMHCLYRKRELLMKCTMELALLIPPSLPLQRPLGRLCFLPGSFLLTSTHFFTPVWPNNLCTYKTAYESPHLACIPAEFLPLGSLAIARGLHCSLTDPLPECLLPDEGGEWTRELIVTRGWRGGAALWNFFIEPLGYRDML